MEAQFPHKVPSSSAGARQGTRQRAASMLRRRPGLDIAIVRTVKIPYALPARLDDGGRRGIRSRHHHSARWPASCPKGATWIRQAAASFQPDDNQVTLADGNTLTYDVLIVAPGIRLAWEKDRGGWRLHLGTTALPPTTAPILRPTHGNCLQQVTSGRAIFTQPGDADQMRRRPAKR